LSPRLRLPRVLAGVANTDLVHELDGEVVADVFDALFSTLPGLRNHILDEKGAIRPHVSVFVDGTQSDLDTPVAPDSEVYVLQAVSGG
jgi:molybdopterin converting factor small subunit